MAKALNEMTLEELWRLFPVILKGHNPLYGKRYEEEKAEIIKNAGPKNIVRINHIGSTYVKGLIAKPTIDILLEICEICDKSLLKNNLEKCGWICMSYEEKPYFKAVFNKGYTPQGFSEKVFHLHVRGNGDWGELYFRDYLAQHDDIAKEYGELKLSLSEKFKYDRDGYTNAKTEFINKYTDIARKEFKGKYKAQKY